MNLLIINNINEAVRFCLAKNIKNVFYFPQTHSKLQLLFHQSCFKEIKKTLPGAIYLKDLGDYQFDFISTSSAFDELSFSKQINAKILNQNILIDNYLLKDNESFTNFRKKVEPTLPSSFTDVWQFSDQEVKEKISEYFSDSKASKYFETRNALIGEGFSTGMSKYLASGRLGVKELYNCVDEYEKHNGSNKSTYWIKFELLWREFFYHSGLQFGRKIFSKDGLYKDDNFSKPISFNVTSVVEKIKSNEAIYSAFKELIITGYQSNRMRQIFASFWINDLEIDWRLGAYLFQNHLVDYDVFINWGNWQYLAGVGHDPRGKRYFNTQKQMKSYDPDQKYISYWKQKEIEVEKILESLILNIDKVHARKYLNL